MKKMLKFFAAATAVCLMLLYALPARAQSAHIYAPGELSEIADGIISCKKQEIGVSDDAFLLSGELLAYAGTTASDWYALGLARLNKQDDFSSYLAVLKSNIEERIKTDGTLSLSKATEYHRTALCVMACGGNAQSFGTNENGDTINLINDGVFYRKNLGRQGINGFIWGLITINAGNFTEPQDAQNTRESIIDELLFSQQENGGWTQSGTSADVDITAMAITALSPYYNERSDVKAAVDAALSLLSQKQLPGGDFESGGTPNAESTAQVITALCALKIDPQTDARFIKNGNTPLTGLMRCRLSSGGFTHSYVYDENNPAALPDTENSMAGEQVLYTLCALIRFYESGAPLFDFSDVLITQTEAFCDADVLRVNALPDVPDTSYYSEIISLISKAENSVFGQKQQCLDILYAKKQYITDIRNKIDEINRQISENTHVLQAASFKYGSLIRQLTEDYSLLSPYDKAKINGYDEVLKAKARLDTKTRGVCIFAALTVFVAVSAPLTVKSVKKKIFRRKNEMSELYLKYGDDGE